MHCILFITCVYNCSFVREFAQLLYRLVDPFGNLSNFDPTIQLYGFFCNLQRAYCFSKRLGKLISSASQKHKNFPLLNFMASFLANPTPK